MKKGIACLICLMLTMALPTQAQLTHAMLTSAPSTQTASNTSLHVLRQNGFIYCVDGLINSFNPQHAKSGVLVDTLSAQLYDRLLDVDPYTYRLIPELAERWETLDNGARYRFHLRHDVPFQTTNWYTPSRNMNADDVLFSFNRVINPSAPYHDVNGGDYPYFDSLQFSTLIKAIHKIDSHTVEISLTRPDSAFLWHLATHYAPILSAEYAETLDKMNRQQQIDRLPIGTGPFWLNEYSLGQYIRLVRNDHYWRGEAKMQQVVIDLATGGTGRLSKLLTGECDVLAYPAASQLSVLRNDPRLRISLGTGMNTAYLAFNTQKAPLNEQRVRKAIALAIDNARLIQSIYYGTAEAATSLLPRMSWAYDKTTQFADHNIAEAKQKLTDAGIEKLTLSLGVPTASKAYNPSPMKMAQLIQADLARIDIQVDIVPIEDRFQESLLENNERDLILIGWTTDSNDPDSFLRPLLSCAGIESRTNYARWCNPEFDRLLAQGTRQQNLAERIDTYKQAQRLIAQELPVLPLASSLRIQAYRYDIKGLIQNPLGNASFKDIYREHREDIQP